MISVVVDKAFRYRVYPSAAQEATLRQWGGTLRFLWNLAHEQRLWGLGQAKEDKTYYTAFDQINQLTELRPEASWINDVPRDSCAQLLIELDKAWQRCFLKLADRPRWKRRGSDDPSLCAPDPKSWYIEESSGSRLHFPKLGFMPIIVHRPFEGKPKTCTITHEADQWFASIMCEVTVEDPVPRTEPIVALDRGITNLVADSNGSIVLNPKHLEKSLRQLRHACKVASRRQKGSANQKKAYLRVSRIHRKIRRQRDHVLHTLSAHYAENQGTVVVEDLQIANMVRNHRLARHISGAAWGRLCTLLGYKLEWHGGNLAKVPAPYSSQTCSVCGHVDAASRHGERFCCTKCGHTEHADVNAAKVLLARYLMMRARANGSGNACGGMLPESALRSRKRLKVPRRSSKVLRNSSESSAL